MGKTGMPSYSKEESLHLKRFQGQRCNYTPFLTHPIRTPFIRRTSDIRGRNFPLKAYGDSISGMCQKGDCQSRVLCEKAMDLRPIKNI